MRCRPLLVPVLAAGCLREDVSLTTDGTAGAATNTAADPTTSVDTSGGMSSGGGTEGTSTGDGADPTTGGPASTGPADTTGGAPVPPPAVLLIDVPLEVEFSGPLPVKVHTQHAAAAEVSLDDGEKIYLENEGDLDGDGVDVFSGELPIYGTPDNGDRIITATARRDGLEDSMAMLIEVSTPAAGTLAWGKHGGAGSKTTRLATTPDGHVYEAGSLEINGLPRPALRLRDPVTGADVWKEGARVLDAREGSIAEVAPTPDGRVWVAMNVREGNTWIARIALFTEDMQPTGAELVEPGATVTAIATDAAGACFAVGYAVTTYGDSDVLVWRMTTDGLPIISGASWDYVPDGKESHTFNDLAFDVVLDRHADEAWIVGSSYGKHDKVMQIYEVRGTILHVDVDTFEPIGPVLVAPPVGNLKQSMYYGAWLEPESVLVSGYQCDAMCANQYVSATRYDFAGVPTWGYTGPSSSVAIGYGIASDTHGTVLIAASLKDGATVHGYLFGRRGADAAFGPVVFPGKDVSGATSVVVGPYDWPFTGGNVTVNGASQGYVMHTHP